MTLCEAERESSLVKLVEINGKRNNSRKRGALCPWKAARLYHIPYRYYQRNFRSCILDQSRHVGFNGQRKSENWSVQRQQLVFINSMRNIYKRKKEWLKKTGRKREIFCVFVDKPFYNLMKCRCSSRLNRLVCLRVWPLEGYSTFRFSQANWNANYDMLLWYTEKALFEHICVHSTCQKYMA